MSSAAAFLKEGKADDDALRGPNRLRLSRVEVVSVDESNGTRRSACRAQGPERGASGGTGVGGIARNPSTTGRGRGADCEGRQGGGPVCGAVGPRRHLRRSRRRAEKDHGMAGR